MAGSYRERQELAEYAYEVNPVELATIFLLIVISYLLFDIRSRLPRRDYAEEAWIRDMKNKEMEKHKNEMK